MTTDLKRLQKGSKKLVHDLRNTLTTTELTIANIKKHLPELISTYRATKQNNLLKNNLSNQSLTLLEALIENNLIEVRHAALTLTFFSESMIHEDIEKTPEPISIKCTLNHALQNFPYRSKSDAKFKYTPLEFEDFTIKANPSDMRLLFFGLIHLILSNKKAQTFYALTVRESPQVSNSKHTKQSFEDVINKDETSVNLDFCLKIAKRAEVEINCFYLNEIMEVELSFPQKSIYLSV